VTATYAYDGDGRRIKKTVNGNTTTFVYDAMGQVAAEYGGEAPPAYESGTRFLFTDHLGSTRLMANANGTQTKAYDYLPFGEEIGAFYPTTGGALDTKFTGHAKDAETGLDFMQARYYSGAQGRFTSPDLPFADQHAANPQSWNLYSYGRNNPLSGVDPDGRSFWAKFGNWVGSNCWCEGEELERRMKANREENERQIEALRTSPEARAIITSTITYNFSVMQETLDAGIEQMTESAVLQPYEGPGGGHHVPAKSAFAGATNYDASKALAIPNAELTRLGIRHSDITTGQMQGWSPCSEGWISYMAGSNKG
jgi:RHS repeat-associated protein